MRCGVIVLTGALLVGFAGSGHGQEAQPPVPVGSRVQVTIPDAAAQRVTPFVRTQLVRGEVTRIVTDTIYVRPAPALGSLAVPTASVRRLDVSLGPPRRSSSALVRGIEHAVVFALAGVLLYSEGEREFGVTSRSEAAALGAGVGLVGGAVIGALAPFERWQRVRLPSRQ